ncbi:hypothetical protein C8T65DRAFT_523951, partial [Cerioporus squamosus]
WRCLDCVGVPKLCARCMRTAHARLPFHRIEFWAEDHYTSAWLRMVGLQIFLGHGGDACPTSAALSFSTCQTPPTRATPAHPTYHRRARRLGAARTMVIVDTSGVHEIPVSFCTCSNAPSPDLQLLRMGLYPATSRRPETAFTFRVLDHFLLTNKVCKTPAMSYYMQLRRTTNPLFPHMVPDRYRDLLHVSRQWRNLKARKAIGVGYEDTPQPTHGSFVVRCPACPWIGVNMPEDWQNDPNPWKHGASAIMDGNFGAQHQAMKHPEHDVRLADGHGFMVTSGPYKDHLKTAKQFRQTLECNKHRAVIAAAQERAPLESTGIGAAACSRHGFFFPHCVVDFQKGEQQKNMDYCLYWVTQNLAGVVLLTVLYDIWCHYWIHLLRRFSNSPALSFPPGMVISGGIGQFHVHAHRRECYPRFSPNFIPGMGVVKNEIIESLWPDTNDIANSTRGMATGHCQESIDDHMNDSNWMKLTRLPAALARKLRTASEEIGPAREALQAMIQRHPANKIARWTKAAQEAAKKRHNNYEVMDIYEVEDKKLPTRAQIQLELAKQENTRKGSAPKGAAAWIVAGLKIEESRCVVRSSFRNINLILLAVAAKARHMRPGSSTEEKIALEQMRAKLLRDIEKFNKDARTFLSQAALPPRNDAGGSDDEDEAPVLAPERLSIPLPSTLGAALCSKHGLSQLVKQERRLRIGQMNDALHNVRVGVGYKSLLYRTEVRQAGSQRQKLRSYDDVHLADAGILAGARLYDTARTAMTRLYDQAIEADKAELDAELRRYQVLQKQDLKANTALIEQSVRGVSHLHLPWFWTLSTPGEGASGSWDEETNMPLVYRVVYLRAYARVQRLEEELALVPAEMLRTLASYETHRDCWKTRARDTCRGDGYIAWGTRQAALW